MSLPPALIVQAGDLPDAQRTALADWQSQLSKLIAQQRGSPRTSNRQLATHFASAIRGAHCSLTEACASTTRDIVTEAAERVLRYFGRLGDARAAASQFPAMRDLAAFLHGPDTDLDLRELAAVADETVVLISRLLAGEAVWQFKGDGQ